MKLFALTLLLFCSTAFADRNTPIKAMAFANGAMMSTPPLPLLRGKKGASTLKLMPTYFTGSLDPESGANSGDGTRQVLKSDFSGVGGAATWSSLFTDNLGWYITLSGQQTTGEFSFELEDPSSNTFTLNITDLQSSLLHVSTGISFTLFANSALPFQVFGGPGYAITTVKQTVKTVGATSDDDFDMELSPSTPILFAGAQTAIRFGNWLELNPYFVFSQLLNEDDKCQTFESTVRQTGALFDFGDPGCQDGQNSSTSSIQYDTAFTAYGVYIGIPRWNFAINAYAEFSGPENFDGVEFQLYAINLQFNWK